MSLVPPALREFHALRVMWRLTLCLVGSSKENRNVGGYDAPTFRQAHPYLAPAPLTDFAVDGALKFESDAPIVFPERNDIEPPDGARQVGGRAPFAEGFDLLDPIQIFACAKAHGVRR